MYSLLLLLVLVASSGGNAEIIRTSEIVGYEMGGSQVTFSLNDLATEEIDLLICVVRFNDGNYTTKIEPSVTRDRLSAICRLPSYFTGGPVEVDLAVKRSTTHARSTEPKTNAITPQPLFVDPTLLTEVAVVENWDTNQLTLTWNIEYFRQFFNEGATILIQLSVYVAWTFVPAFVASDIVQLVGQNVGSTTITLTAQNVARLTNVQFPYFYVLRAVGTQSDIYAASGVFAPTLGMNEPSAQRTCSNWLMSAETPAPEEIHPCPPCLCQVELDANFIESAYHPQLIEFANGTLNDHVLYYERVPTQSGHAQTCSYSRSTRNLATTSPAQASWIHFVSKFSSYVGNYFADIWPYIVCCQQSNSQELCDSFHERRPVDTGHDYPGTENPCTGWGDPHMVTFESTKYDFMGHGEFWLIHGPNGSDFGVQGRMSPNTIGQKVSFYKAVAAKDRNTTVQIEMRAGNLLVFLNGTQLQFSTLPVTLRLNSVFLIINVDRVELRLQTGFSIIVESRAGIYIDVFGSGAQFNKGKGFMGIFGNFDDDPNNDLTSRDGFVIPPTTENLRDLSKIHHRFGLTWQVYRNETYFVYEDGKSWYDHANIDFGPIDQYPDPSTMPDEVRAICGDSLFCYFEYVGTGSLERAADVANTEVAFDELREQMGRTIPMCDTLSPPPNGRVLASGHLDGASATYSCNRHYDFESGNRLRTCSASETKSEWKGEEPVCIWTCTICDESVEFRLSHDPNDCSKFFLCNLGMRFSLDCPTAQSFDRSLETCSSEYNCSGTPGC